MYTLKVFRRGVEARDKRVEIVDGTVHLFRDVYGQSITFGSLVPDDRSENLCILGVPSTMEADDFLQITTSFSDSIRKLQCIRNGDEQIMLLSFDSQGSADAFFRFYNGNLLPVKVAICHVLFTKNAEYTNSLEEACEAPPGLTEIPTCSLCLERLDEHISGVPTTFIDVLGPRDSSCLVCRYCMHSENLTCSICPTTENLWVCVICGFIGCGRYKEGHAIRHWKETRHCYSLELESQRVWDYVGDNYVHRIIQSKTDGNLLELMAPPSDDCASCECSQGPDAYDRSYNSKLHSLEIEYQSLLAKQSDSQKKYYERRLVAMLEERDSEIAAAIDKQASARLHKLQQKLDQIEEEKKFLSQVNQCFTDNQKKWETKLDDLEKRGSSMLELKDKQIADLEQQVQRLMHQLER